ncbi:MAG: lipopolysaccharide biosynthesis protein [Muribaculaceae bacterium]|nr:lipopolysaccharide biosynthesis protein [Muribaculaceae bacterium]
MATNIKSLAKDTAIYGLSSICGRFINYLLVPIQTAKFAASSGDYGIVTNIYAYTALLIVILTYGMETTFFRYANKDGEDPKKVYSTTMSMVGCTSMLFIALVLLFITPISGFMGYAEHPSFVACMFVCVALDAFQCIPFAYLRYKNRAIKFAALKIINIVLNIILNLLYLVILPALKINLFGIYDDNFTLNVGYVFYINLLCTIITMFMLHKEIRACRFRIDKALLHRMLKYAWPLLILGIAGNLNQSFDKMAFKKIYLAADQDVQLGIYGAAVKIAMIMAMITQAFRYAYEPFVFGKTKDKDNRETYAKAMKYFIVFTLLAFLAVIAWMDVMAVKLHIIAPGYEVGLKVVPIVMAAEIMMGVYFNLSFWYKLIDKTIWGAYFSGIGCAVLIAINIIFVPRFGYMACAWGGFAGYGIAMVLSYFVGQKYYPIKYPLADIGVYVAVAAVLFAAMMFIPFPGGVWTVAGFRTLLLIVFFVFILKREHMGGMFKRLPLVGRFF